MNYDHNGNITDLQRNRRKYQSSTLSYIAETMDNLAYTYNTTIGDQLQKVEDATAITDGFNNGANTTTEYTYDSKGNLTSDQNKGISAITYNFLGKPTQITFTDGRKIQYVYDATGDKLTMKTYAVGASTPSLTTDYVGGFVYENTSLSFYSSPEGRVVMNKSYPEYQYAIADHQGNTRVVFTSAAPVAETTTVNSETTTNDSVQNYPTGGARNSVELFDHTDTGSTYTYSQLLNGGVNGQVGIAKSFKVFPGDKIKIEAYAKYQNLQSTNTDLTAFTAGLLAAFGAPAPGAGETGTASSGLSSYGNIVATGNGPGDNDYPKAFVNIIIYDKNYNVLDIAYDQIDGGEQIGVSPKAAHDYMSSEYIAKEAGYAYVYISNENPTFVDVYFDDVTITRTPTSVVQYNEYYPFGLQAGTSWTRDDSKNSYLYNAGAELNATSGWYDLFFRNYDPVLGRFVQIDPLSVDYADMSGYQYAMNNPGLFNDPLGDKVSFENGVLISYESMAAEGAAITEGMARMQQYFDSWYQSTRGGGGGGVQYTFSSLAAINVLTGKAAAGDERAAGTLGALYSDIYTVEDNSYVDYSTLSVSGVNGVNVLPTYVKSMKVFKLQQTNYRENMSQQEIAIFDSMTKGQQLHYLSNGRYAKNLAKQLFDNANLIGGKGDGFRHALFSALNARDLGLDLAKRLGDAHELMIGNDYLDFAMDLNNNQVGRDIFVNLNERGLGRGHFSTAGFVISILEAIKHGSLCEIGGFPQGLVNTKK